MKNRAILTLIFIVLISAFLFADPPDWTAIQGTQYSMVVMANVTFYGENFVASGNNMVAAFGPNGEDDCRSVATWQESNPPYYDGFWFFTIGANIEGELISFKIYDAENDSVYDCEETIAFSNNQTIGDPFDPYQITASGVDASSEVISVETFLGNAYPNPFSIDGVKSTIKIEYNVSKDETGELEIFNLKGQKIKSYPYLKGNNNIAWDMKDDNKKIVSSGIYFYRLKTTSWEQTRKFVITK